MDLQRYVEMIREKGLLPSDFKIIRLPDEKTDLELKLDNCNHTMELIRTIVPILVLIVQVIILVKI